ncbi:MAG: winged helix-turn-helix domain-containing protein [Acidobacteriota bacterium]|nr:winged helix-turn-helix domain-containing protein [Acidobacteriota bacterium]
MKALNGNLLEFGDFQLDKGKKILRRSGEILPLPPKAVELLAVLAENQGEVLTKADLMEKIWGDAFVEEGVLTQNVYLLRKTLGKNNPIKNIPRRGYVFQADVKAINPNGLTPKFEKNEAETIVERHVFEKIRVEEIETEAAKRESSGNAKSKPKKLPILTALVFAAAILIALTVSAYLYFRGDSRQPMNDAAPPIKLKAVSTPSAVKTLAVLPLKSADEKFAAVFSNNLSVRLGSQNKFNVKPFDLVEEYLKNGAELKTDFVLEGEVLTRNNLYAANVRLFDTKAGVEIWRQKFEFNNQNQLEDAITNQVGRQIFSKLTEAEREAISRRLPTNFDAYTNFQKGYRLWRSRKDGTKYFARAIELDQNFARGYAGLASQKMTQGGKNSLATKETEALLQTAFELDEHLADAYAAQGFVRIFHYRDWEGAEKSLKNALELDANNVNAHHWLAVFYSIHRRLDDAKAEMRAALELDPTNPTLLADFGQLHYFAGERDLALKFIENALLLDPNHFFAKEYLTKINQQQEIKDKEAVLQQLSKADEENAFTLPYINVDPFYDSLRDEPRFRKILRNLNLK